MSQAAAFLRRGYLAARPLAASLFAVPVLGYVLHILVDVLKLPRINSQLRSLGTEVRRLDTSTVSHSGFEARIALLNARMTSLEQLQACVTSLDELQARVTSLEELQVRVTALEELQARVTSLQDTWQEHFHLMLNVIDTIPAVARELVRLRERFENVTERSECWDASTPGDLTTQRVCPTRNPVRDH